MDKLKIVYMGTPEFAVAPLKKLAEAGYEIAGVVTVPDKASGRGLKIQESDVKKYAKGLGCPIMQPEKLKDPSFIEQLRALNADLFIVVAFRMLPEIVWSMPRMGTFNLHASLLPQYRGAAPINWAVINGESETGVTTFMLDKDIDTGSVILRKKCNIEPEDTAGSLHDKLMELGCDAVLESVAMLASGNACLTRQSEIQAGELKPAPKLTKELCKIDWKKDSGSIERLIKGLSPHPGAFSMVQMPDGSITQVKIYDAESSADPCEGNPGEIKIIGKSSMLVKCGKGGVFLKSLQLAGKKRLDAKDFLSGFRNPENCIML